MSKWRSQSLGNMDISWYSIWYKVRCFVTIAGRVMVWWVERQVGTTSRPPGRSYSVGVLRREPRSFVQVELPTNSK
jgi:hypothetical protein